MSEDNLIKVNGIDDALDLAEIAGLSMDDVELNYGPDALAAGIYEFKVIDAELVKRDTKNGPRACVQIENEVVNCLSVVNAGIDPSSLIGRKHYENYFLINLKEDMGKVKALMVGAGFVGEGSFTDLLTQFIGHNYLAQVNNKRDRDDADLIRANINLKKVRPAA